MCFGASNNTTTVSLPSWFESAAQSNVGKATTQSNKPFVPYTGDRVQQFSGDQNRAMQLLRDKPSAPRLIDNIPGGAGATGGAGSLQDYMNPYDQFVIDRGLGNLRRSTDQAQQAFNVGAHQAGAFGDARHGVGAGEIERAAGDTASDFISSNLQRSYDTAQGLRSQDIDRGQKDFYSFIDSLFKSGAQQQELGQKGKDVAYEQFQAQQNHPIDMINLLTSVLTGTPHGSKTTTPGPSVAGQILGSVGALGSLFI